MKSKSVLVVDDKGINRLLPGLILRPFGWTVHETDSGLDVLSMLKKFDVACVLLDISMPDISGLDVLKNIDIDMKTLPITKTNKEFNALLMNFNLTDFQKDINNYFTNYELEYHTQIDFNDKKNYIKNVKNAIHYLLNEIGINFKYQNKNNTKDNDKIIFYFEDFNTEKPLYQGRLIDNHFQTDKFKKYKKGFKTKDGLTDLYKQSILRFSGEKKDYYTTYKVKQNKSINYLANRKTDETLYIDLMNHILNKELKNYLCNKFRPYIIDEYEYKTKLVKYLL
jgi:CheY-like chemotaxis protein